MHTEYHPRQYLRDRGRSPAINNASRDRNDRPEGFFSALHFRPVPVSRPGPSSKNIIPENHARGHERVRMHERNREELAMGPS